MTRSARHAAFGAFVALVGCSVYDQSLLTGGVGGAGTVSGAGGAHASAGGASPTSGRGGTTGGSASSGGSGSSGGSAATGGGSAGRPSGSQGGSSGDGSGATGASSTTGGAVAMGGTGGDAAGGTGNIDSSGGMGDEGGAPNPGEGGTSGGGSGGSDPGAGGTGASGGSAGMATGGAGGGPPATATGCAKLTASLAASTDKTHYLITLGSADVDFTNAVVNVHLYAEGADGGVFIYVQQATYEFFGMPLVPFSTFSGWTTLTWDLSAASTSPVDKATVRRLGLEIGGTGGTDFANPTVVYVDAITVTTPALSFSFDAASSVNTTATTYHAGDTALWQNSASADTTATGSTLEWVASCP